MTNKSLSNTSNLTRCDRTVMTQVICFFCPNTPKNMIVLAGKLLLHAWTLITLYDICDVISPDLRRMSLTSCGLCVTRVQMCSCCASASSAPPPSRTFPRSGFQRSGDTPPSLRSSSSGRSVTSEETSRWRKYTHDHAWNPPCPVSVFVIVRHLCHLVLTGSLSRVAWNQRDCFWFSVFLTMNQEFQIEDLQKHINTHVASSL